MVEYGSGGGMEQWEIDKATFNEANEGIDISIFVRTMKYRPIKHSFFTPGTEATKKAMRRMKKWMDVAFRVPVPEHKRCICVNDLRKGNKCGPGSKCIARDNGYECGPECSVKGCICINNEMTRGGRDKKMSLISRGTIVGYGVMAQEQVKPDEFICPYDGEYFPEDDNPFAEGSFYTSALLSSDPPYKEVSVEAAKCGSKGRFINTSCKPSAKIWTIRVGDTLRLGIYATSLIFPGDEITINYGTRFHAMTGLCCRCGHHDKCPDMHKSYPCEQRNENTEVLTLGEQIERLHHRVYGRDQDSECRQELRAIHKHAKKRIIKATNYFKEVGVPLEEYADFPSLDGWDSLDDKNKLSDFSDSDETYYQKTKREQRVRRRKRKELARIKAASDKAAAATNAAGSSGGNTAKAAAPAPKTTMTPTTTTISRGQQTPPRPQQPLQYSQHQQTSSLAIATTQATNTLAQVQPTATLITSSGASGQTTVHLYTQTQQVIQFPSTFTRADIAQAAAVFAQQNQPPIRNVVRAILPPPPPPPSNTNNNSTNPPQPIVRPQWQNVTRSEEGTYIPAPGVATGKGTGTSAAGAAAATGSKSPGKVVPTSVPVPSSAPESSSKSSKTDRPESATVPQGNKSPKTDRTPPGSAFIPSSLTGNKSPKKKGCGSDGKDGGSGSGNNGGNGNRSAAVPTTGGGSTSRPNSPMVVSLPSSPRAIPPVLVDPGVFQFWPMFPPIGQPLPEYRKLLRTSTTATSIQKKKKKKTIKKGPEKRKEPEDPKLSPEDKTERKRSKTKLKLKKQPCPSSSALDVAPSSQTRATTPTQTPDKVLYNYDSDLSYFASPKRVSMPAAAAVTNDVPSIIPLVLEEEDMTTSQSASSTSNLPAEPQQPCSSSQKASPKQQSSQSKKKSSQEKAKTPSPFPPPPPPPATMTIPPPVPLLGKAAEKAIEKAVEKAVDQAVGRALEIALEKVVELDADTSPCKSPENEKSAAEERPQTPVASGSNKRDDDDDDDEDDGISPMDIEDPCLGAGIPDTVGNTGDMDDDDDDLDDPCDSEDVTATELSSAAATSLESVVPSSTTVVKRKPGRPINTAKNKDKKYPRPGTSKSAVDNASATTEEDPTSLSSTASRRRPGLRNRDPKKKKEDVVAPSSSQSEVPSSSSKTGKSTKASQKSKGAPQQMDEAELHALVESEIAKLTYIDSIGRQYALARTDPIKGGTYGRPTNEQWKCFFEKCCRHFTNIPEYRHHLLTQHLKLKDKKCNVCGKGFNTDEELKKHMKTHDPKQPKYECIKCGAQYKTAGDLGRHHNKLSPGCNSNFYDVISYDGKVKRTQKRKPDPNLPDPPPLTEAQQTRRQQQQHDDDDEDDDDGETDDEP